MKLMGSSRYLRWIIKILGLFLGILLLVQTLLAPNTGLLTISSPSANYYTEFQISDDQITRYLPFQAGVLKDGNDAKSNDIRQKLLVGEEQRQKAIDNLRGKTLEIYNLLVESGETLGVREVQRHFGYSSPNLASYHLDKLYHLDLLIKTQDNRYTINDDADLIGDFKHKIKIFDYWVDSHIVMAMIMFAQAFLGVLFSIFQLSYVIWLCLTPIHIMLGIWLLRKSSSFDPGV